MNTQDGIRVNKSIVQEKIEPKRKLIYRKRRIGYRIRDIQAGRSEGVTLERVVDVLTARDDLAAS